MSKCCQPTLTYCSLCDDCPGVSYYEAPTTPTPEPLPENVFISTQDLFMEVLDRLCAEADDLYEKGDAAGSQRLFDMYSLVEITRNMYKTAMDEPILVKLNSSVEDALIDALMDSFTGRRF